MDFNTLLVVCPLVFLGGFVDAVGGGGALIAVPAYLLAGIPPHMAIGTNKLSSCMGKAASIFKLARSGFVDWKLAPLPVLVSFVGSYAGASIALNLPPEVFEIILLVLLPIVAAIVLRKRKHDSEHIDMPYAKRVGIFGNGSKRTQEQVSIRIGNLQGRAQQHGEQEENGHLLLFEQHERIEAES